MMNRKKQRKIAVVICAILIVAMLVSIVASMAV